jgi:hypothetical protein
MDVGLSERVEYRRVRPCKGFGDIKVWPVFLVVSSSDFALDFAQKKRYVIPTALAVQDPRFEKV